MKRYFHKTDPKKALQILTEIYMNGKSDLEPTITPTIGECAQAAAFGKNLFIIVCIEEEAGKSTTYVSFKEIEGEETDIDTIMFLSTFKRDKDDKPKKISEGIIGDVIYAKEAYEAGKRVRRFNAGWPEGWIRLGEDNQKIEEGDLIFDEEGGQTLRYLSPIDAMRQRDYIPEKKWLIDEN